MKRFLNYILGALLLTAIVSACSDSLETTQNYDFEFRTMPYPARIIQGETIEIRCEIVTEGNYAGTSFFIRYFQTDGRGELRLDDGRILTPNDLFPLTNKVFRLYYTSHSTDQQNLDIYIENSFGRVVQRSFSFSNETVRQEE